MDDAAAPPIIVSAVAFIFLGVVFGGVGTILRTGRIARNNSIGIRTPATLTSDEAAVTAGVILGGLGSIIAPLITAGIVANRAAHAAPSGCACGGLSMVGLWSMLHVPSLSSLPI